MAVFKTPTVKMGLNSRMAGFSSVATQPFPLTTTVFVTASSIHSIPTQTLPVITENIVFLFNTQGSLLQIQTLILSPSKYPSPTGGNGPSFVVSWEYTSITVFTPSILTSSTQQTTSNVPSMTSNTVNLGSFSLTTTTTSPSSTPPTSTPGVTQESLSCSAWHCWSKSQQGGTIAAVVLTFLGISAIIWWGLCRRSRRRAASARQRDLETGGRARPPRGDAIRPGSMSSLGVISRFVDDIPSPSTQLGDFHEQPVSLDREAPSDSRRRHSMSFPRDLGSHRYERVQSSPMAQKYPRDEFLPPATTIATIAAQQNENNTPRALVKPQKSQARLASPSKYLPKRAAAEDQKQAYKENRSLDIRRSGKDVDRQPRDARRVRSRSFSPPRQNRDSTHEEEGFDRNKSKLEKDETKAGPSKAQMLLPLALEALDILSKPKKGLRSKPPEEKQHEPETESPINERLEQKHAYKGKEVPQHKNNDDVDRQGSRQRMRQRSNSAHVPDPRYRKSVSRSRQPDNFIPGVRIIAESSKQQPQYSFSEYPDTEELRRRVTRQDVRTRQAEPESDLHSEMPKVVDERKVGTVGKRLKFSRYLEKGKRAENMHERGMRTEPARRGSWSGSD